MRNWIAKMKEKVYLASKQIGSQEKVSTDVQDKVECFQELEEKIAQAEYVASLLTKLKEDLMAADDALVSASNLISTKEHVKKARVQEAQLRVRKSYGSVLVITERLKDLFVNKLK